MPADRDLREDGPTCTPPAEKIRETLAGDNGQHAKRLLGEILDGLVRPMHLLDSEPEGHRVAACGAREHSHAGQRFDFSIDAQYASCVDCLRAALREAGQYEQVEGAAWDHQRGIVMYGVKPGALGVDWRPLYRKSTEAGSSASTSAAGSSAPAAPIDTPRSEQR